LYLPLNLNIDLRMTFSEKLDAAVQTANSTLCVGLDPNLELLPAPIINRDRTSTQKVALFLKKVIDATEPYCAAYKPNLGFFEALGPDGWDLLAGILDYIPNTKVVIADAKRGDISSTAEHYAKAFFEKFEVDAITLNPLMGFETLDPFLNNSSKGIFVLTLTSNPGANDILLQKLANGHSLCTHISTELAKKQQQADTAVGMVVGATKAEQLRPVVEPFPEAPLLIPGVGRQGGDIAKLAEALEEHQGIPLINSSRSIIYAGDDDEEWPRKVAQAAEDLTNRLSPITERYVQEQ
jgi:orotidine-5'-phosphate decarboxylase